MKFAHFADCHLGGWRQPELRELNLESFRKAVDISISEKVEFVLIAGDLFDSAYPPVEILGETFVQMKRLSDNRIPCYIIAGSHDYSASGKTFLSVLEKAGFCKNLFNPQEKDSGLILNPVIHGQVALYGYPGKKSGMEVQELRKIKLSQAPGLFRILALHTTIEEAVGNLPIDYIKKNELPEADYYALGHLHLEYNGGKFVYGGPTFPNNFQELRELKSGRFYIVNTSPFKVEKVDLKIKDVEEITLEISEALTATDLIKREIDKREVKDKIVLLRLKGKLEQGKTSSINFKEIEQFAKDREAFTFLKNTTKLKMEETEVNFEIEDMDKLEEEIIEKHIKEKDSKFNKFVFPLINVLSAEKKEAETKNTFKSRLFSELNKALELELE